MPQLSFEQIGDPKDSQLGIAHGIFGRGVNWRTFSKKWMSRCPGWGALLIDLRGHGRSKGMPRPHSLDAAASDVVRLCRQHHVNALLGHSFGGKVVMKARSQLDLKYTIVVDASPSALLGSTSAALLSTLPSTSAAVRALQILETLPPTFESRADFIAQAMGDGLPSPVAQFLATNLQRGDLSKWKWAVDLSVIRELLTSYYSTDCWSEIEASVGGPLTFVIASRQSALSAKDVARLDQFASIHDHLEVHPVDSGHWVHVDAEPHLLDIVASTTC